MLATFLCGPENVIVRPHPPTSNCMELTCVVCVLKGAEAEQSLVGVSRCFDIIFLLVKLIILVVIYAITVYT